jgi:N-acylglucosamine-6-phosphate 2-epimerase
MVYMARAAVAGGASGIRAAGVADITAIRDAVSVPIIGLVKRRVDGYPVYITPTFEDAAVVARAGADAIALDATARPRPGGEMIEGLLARIDRELGLPVVADVDSVESAVRAAHAGAACVATTLAGYTEGPVPSGPDIDLVAAINQSTDCPVFAEGRYQEPRHVEAALRAGAHAVVVGEAVTDPVALTQRLVEVAEGSHD